MGIDDFVYVVSVIETGLVDGRRSFGRFLNEEVFESEEVDGVMVGNFCFVGRV